MKFEWDENKNRVNMRKHDIAFKDAKTVFDDPSAVYIFDENHSDDEERFLVIGLDSIYRELCVCHCYHGDNEEIIRIISAWRATSREKEIYSNGGN